MTLRAKKLTGLLFFFMFSATSLFAQADQSKVSDEELTRFATVYQQMRMMNQQIQQKMAQVVAGEEMEIQRFNEIHQANLTPDMEVEVSEEEKETYQDILEEIEEIQAGFQNQMEEIIEESGFSMERYEAIATRLQSDAKLQERLRKTFQQ